MIDKHDEPRDEARTPQPESDDSNATATPLVAAQDGAPAAAATDNLSATAAEPAPATAPAPSDPVATIPRSAINYIIVGLVFLAIGFLTGVVVYDRVAESFDDRQTALINSVNEAIEIALADL
ncbi:MAG: hypothetical protein GYB67_04785, partial [Chloroflexi bacterium]|nr:hypothetical protein [Chloroflexota bacterium]